MSYAHVKKALTKENPKPYVGVDVRGFHTSMQSKRYPIAFPSDFYEKSFALISKAGMNHIRYAFYWEAYEKESPGVYERVENCCQNSRADVT